MSVIHKRTGIERNVYLMETKLGLGGQTRNPLQAV